jgi:hypothetical protein
MFADGFAAEGTAAAGLLLLTGAARGADVVVGSLSLRVREDASDAASEANEE